MKKIIIAICIFNAYFFSAQQVLNSLPTIGLAPNNKAYCGIGTVQINPTFIPNQNLQIHGVNTFSRTFSPPKIIIPSLELGGEPQLQPVDLSGPLVSTTINYGYTAGISFTNSTTGTGLLEGGVVRISENEFVMENLEENGSMRIFTPKILRLGNAYSSLTFRDGIKEVFINGEAQSTANIPNAAFNINGSGNNGLKILGMFPGKYGISVKMAANNDDAVQVFSANGVTKNFFINGTGEVLGRQFTINSITDEATNFYVNNSGEVMARQFSINNSSNETKNFYVNNSGEVYARKYTTTLQNIPDYVFESSYQLMPINELKSYIKTNHHLPNIPSAKEIEAKGGEVDLGEMNRLLLEKLEETTLYIFQL